MTQLQTSSDVYETFGRMLEHIAASPGFARRARQMERTLQFRLNSPDAVVTARFTTSAEPAVEFGDTALTPDVTISMSSLDAHRWMLGELNVFLAIDRGAMKITGPSREFLAVFPQLRRSVSPVYRRVVLGDHAEAAVSTRRL